MKMISIGTIFAALFMVLIFFLPVILIAWFLWDLQ